MWQSTMDWQTAKLRAEVLHKIRGFFHKRDVIEVETPNLSQHTVTDVHLDAFESQYQFPLGKKPLYLQTSPEYAMKRLLASGYGAIYQITKAYRDEAYGRHHNPEFTMLEWYRPNFDHLQLMDEVEALLTLVLKTEKAEKFTYQQVFLIHTNIDPLETDKATLKDFLNSHDISDDWLMSTDCIDTLLQFIFSQFVETKIGKTTPCFVYDFPISQASLAVQSETDPRVAHRFECYYKGIELVNGFNELTDAKIQESRFEVDNIQRLALAKHEKPLDTLLLAALSSGMPQCSGVALGVDRLVMLALDIDDITNVLSFTIENA